MRTCEVHAAVVAMLAQPVAASSIKGCLAGKAQGRTLASADGSWVLPTNPPDLARSVGHSQTSVKVLTLGRSMRLADNGRVISPNRLARLAVDSAYPGVPHRASESGRGRARGHDRAALPRRPG